MSEFSSEYDSQEEQDLGSSFEEIREKIKELEIQI